MNQLQYRIVLPLVAITTILAHEINEGAHCWRRVALRRKNGMDLDRRQ